MQRHDGSKKFWPVYSAVWYQNNISDELMFFTGLNLNSTTSLISDSGQFISKYFSSGWNTVNWFKLMQRDTVRRDVESTKTTCTYLVLLRRYCGITLSPHYAKISHGEAHIVLKWNLPTFGVFHCKFTRIVPNSGGCNISKPSCLTKI